MARMNSLEKYAAYSMSALALSVGAAACGGKSKSSENCLSPLRSHIALGDKSPGVNANDQNTWVEGEELVSTLPSGAKDLRVAYTDPGGNEHYSAWIAPTQAGRIAMKIGPNDTVLSTQIEAVRGSQLCKVKPDTTFTEKPFINIIYEGATVPKGYHR